MKTYKIAPLDMEAARKGLESWLSKDSGKKNAFRIEREHGSKENLLSEIVSEIASRTLTFRPIRRGERIEPTNGKVRVIGVESVKQQVCDHIACVALEPLLNAKVGFYQVASVKGKGQSMCRRVLKRWVRDARYHVKLDVRKCYQSTSHEVVMRILKKYVKGDDILYLCSALLSTYRQGLEIGSHFSLRIMQLVLSFAYHEVEGMGKLRRGRWKSLVCHQIWYMDDILLIGTDKRDLRVATRRLEKYMRDELGLTLKPWKIAKTSRTEPFDLGGWVVSVGRCSLRGATFLRAMRALRKFVRASSPKNAKRFMAYWGWIVNGNCERLRIDRGIDKAKAHAVRVISFQDRLESRCRLHQTPGSAG